MEDLDTFYRRIQTLLMKKDAECGKLKFLSSRITEDTCRHINDVRESINEIFESSGIKTGEEVSTTNSKCIQAFKYLILNTNFQCQELLMEDFVNGHLVDMCPPLSPYLMVEILWTLKYEGILAESVIHLPLDLTVEILEIIRRCIGLLDFQRAFDSLCKIIFNAYKKISIIRDHGTQSNAFDVNFENFIINIQELIELLSSVKLTRYDDVVGIKKSERHGLILEYIIQLIMNCLELSHNNIAVPKEMEKSYRVTFGREKMSQCDIATVNAKLDILHFQMLSALSKKVEEIDCKTYIDWASLESNGDSSISLQQAIGLDCFRMVDLLKLCQIEGYEDLIKCLEQISLNPDKVSTSLTMDSQQLCEGVEAGKKECMKELMKRYEIWDHKIFETIRKNPSLLDKEDFLNLLEYLTLLMPKPGQEEHKQVVYNTVTKVLFLQPVPEVYQVVLKYILKHDAGDTLESAHTEEIFKNFMLRNVNLKSANNLRSILFFLMKNPRKILKMILKICFGCPEFNKVMIPPNDLGLLSPILTLRDKKDGKLVLSVLEGLIVEETEWEPKKFLAFIESMLKQRIFTTDELINNVYIRWLQTDKLSVSCLKSTLNSLRQITYLCTTETRLEILISTLAGKMSFIRRNQNVGASKYVRSELLTLMMRILPSLLLDRNGWYEESVIKQTVINIENRLQPIDKWYFIKSCHYEGYLDLTDIVQDYKRRIQNVLFRIADREKDATSIDSLAIDEEIFIHLLTSCTEAEYIKIGTQFVVLHWDFFKLSDEHEAFDNFVRMTIKVCSFCLQASDPATDSFSFMIKSLAQFARDISELDSNFDHARLLKSLVNHFGRLNENIKNTDYASFYEETLVLINNRSKNESPAKSLQEVINSIEYFGSKCSETPETKRPEIPLNYVEHQLTQKFISECLDVAYEINQPSIMVRLNQLIRHNV